VLSKDIAKRRRMTWKTTRSDIKGCEIMGGDDSLPAEKLLLRIVIPSTISTQQAATQSPLSS
jgi:hypothetical protein